MRIQNVEQGLGNFGELVIDLMMNPPGQQREALDEALYVRILAFVGLERQTARDLPFPSVY